MNTESRLEREIKLVKLNDNFKDVEQTQKITNDATWEYFTFDNAKDETIIFKEHLYVTEKKIDKYYYVYKVYFAFADDIEKFEESFMESIVFE